MDSDKKIRILVTASTFPKCEGDSTPRFVLDLCKSLQETGESQCCVLVPHLKGVPTSEILEGVRVKRYRYMIPSSLEKISGLGIVSKIKKNKILALLVPFFLFFQFIAAVRTIREFKPDIVLAHWIIPQGLIALMVKGLFWNLKTILVSHGGDVALIRRYFIFRMLGKVILKKMDRVVGVSSFGKREILRISKLDSKKVEVISMGVDEQKYSQCRDNRKKKYKNLTKCLLFIGRIEEKKGLKYLLRAMPEVLNIYPDVTLKIIGTGSLKEEMVKLCKKLKLDKNVVFLGAVDHSDIPFYLEEGMIFVVPSIDMKGDVEGLPTVIPETIAATVPVIATDAGGIKDIIEDRKTGILVEQKNSEHLADRIIELIEDEKLRHTLTDNAFKRLLERYTYSVIGRKCQDLINNLHYS